MPSSASSHHDLANESISESEQSTQSEEGCSPRTPEKDNQIEIKSKDIMEEMEDKVCYDGVGEADDFVVRGKRLNPLLRKVKRGSKKVG